MVTTEGEASAAPRPGPSTARRTLREDGASRFALYASAVFSVVFIARTSIVVDGRRYFTLFDDAMISMTYARNLADGHGLVWVAGDSPVEGITNPAWTLYMAVWHALGIPSNLVALPIALSGAALVLATAVVARALAIELSGTPWVPAAVTWTVACCYPLSYWSLRGMEVGLLALLTASSALLALRTRALSDTRRLWQLGAIGALGVLTRIDFVIVVAVVAAWLLVTVSSLRWSIVMHVVVPPLTALAVATVGRWVYYDRFVPNTFDLKLGGVPLETRLERGLSVLLGTVAFALVVALALAVIAWCAHPGKRAAISLLVGLFVAQAAYSVWVGGDAWEWMRYANRYLTTALAPLLVVAVLGIESCAAVRRPRRVVMRLAGVCALAAGVVVWIERWHYWPDEPMGTAGALIVPIALAGAALSIAAAVRRPSTAAAVMVVVLISVLSLPALVRWWTNNGAYVGGAAFLTSFGRVLEAATEPDARIAVAAAGALGYHSERPLVDILGKSDPRIAALEPNLDDGFLPGHDKWDLSITVLGDRPDVVAQAFRPTTEELRAIEAAGYRRVGLGEELSERFPEFVSSGRTFYVRCDSEQVRWALLDPADEGCTTR